MIYYVECIPAGTWLLQQLYSKFPVDQLELGCLFDGLSTFLRQPTLAGEVLLDMDKSGRNCKERLVPNLCN